MKIKLFNRIKVKREEASSFVHFIPIVITILLASFCVIAYIQYVSVFNVKDEVDMIARRYIIKMETTGYLQSEDCDELVDELKKIGIYDIDLSGTTMTEVSYGSEIQLVVSGKYDFSSYGIDSLLNFNEDTEVLNINITKASTSQH